MYKNIEEAMAGLAEWKKMLRNRIEPLLNFLPYKLPFELEYYREAALYRFVELTEATYKLYESEDYLSSVILARSSQETLAMLWYLNEKIDTLLRTKDLQKFLERLDKLMHGWSKDDEFPKTIHVMDAIRSVDRVMEGKFERHYDLLSECAHPNWSGTLGIYGQPNHEGLYVDFRKYTRSTDSMRQKIEVTVINNLSLMNSVQEAYSEQITKVLDLCEDLHERGELKNIIYRT